MALDEITISNQQATATITLFGAYVKSWQLKQEDGSVLDLLYQGSQLKRSGIPLLFPNFNAGDPLPSHGFARVSTWRVHTQSDSSVALILERRDLTPEMQKLYPYQFQVILTVVLQENSLIYTLRVNNQDIKSLPLCPGLHPYWPIEHTQKKSIKTNGIPGFEAEKIDWDNQPPDNNFEFSQSAKIEFPDWDLQIRDESTRAVVKRLQVWSQNTEQPDFNFVCFEPVCGLSNSINTDPIIVSPGETWEMKLSFTAHLHH